MSIFKQPDFKQPELKKIGFKKISILGLALFVLTLISCESSKQPLTQPQNLEQINIIKSANDDRQYSALLLSNGLQVVLVSDPSLENSAASLAVGVGSAQDPKNQMGLAHYLEHMLFLGTEKYPEPSGFMKFTQANGGMTNAFTAYDRTNYMFQINATKFDEALDRFSDYFKKPTFDPQYSDKERNAVNNEWSLQKAQDGWNLFALQGITANPANPGSQFNIGNLDTLKDKPDSVLIDEMKNFYQGYYSANIMKLTLVSKQTLPELKTLAEKYFSSIPNHNIALPEVTEPGLTKAQRSKAIHYQSLKDLKMLWIEFPVKNNKQDWRFKPNDYINQLLTSEEPGTLCKELRELGLAKTVGAYVESDAYGPDGFLRVQVELTDEGLTKQDEIIAAVFSYIELIQKQGINKDYFKEFKAIAEKNFTYGSKPKPLDQAIAISMAQFDYPVQHLLNANYFYDQYQPKKIKDLTQQLDKKNARIWYVSKNEKVDKPIPFFDSQYAIRDLNEADFVRWNKLSSQFNFNLPPLNDLLSDEGKDIVEAVHEKPKKIISQPGIEAFLVHSQHYQQEGNGALDLQINSDFSQTSVKNRAMSYLLNDIYNKQTMSLMDKAARVSLKISTGIKSANSQVISISGYSAKLSRLLNQMLTEFVNVKISPVIFAQAQDSFRQGLENNRKDHVFRQTFGHLNRLTSETQTTSEEYLAILKEITIDDLKQYHAQVIKNPLLRLFVAGNYTEAETKEIALALTKILPAVRAPETRVVSQYVTPKKSQIIALAEDIELADSAVLHAWFKDNKSDDEQAQLAVLNAIFGNAFFTQLRTNEQLGYVVTSGQYPIDDTPGFFMLVQSSNTDLPGIKTRMEKFTQEYVKILEQLDEKEVIAAREALMANFLQKPIDFYQEASWYLNEFMLGKYSFDGRDRYLASLKKVTKADLIAIYKSLLLNQQSGQIVIQLRGTNFKNKPFAK